MKRLWDVLVLTLALNFLAVAGLAGWLRMSGRCQSPKSRHTWLAALLRRWNRRLAPRSVVTSRSPNFTVSVRCWESVAPLAMPRGPRASMTSATMAVVFFIGSSLLEWRASRG